MNGEEFLLVHRKKLWNEVPDVIAQVDAYACKTKKSREQKMRGRMLYSPRTMNVLFQAGFERRGRRADEESERT